MIKAVEPFGFNLNHCDYMKYCAGKTDKVECLCIAITTTHDREVLRYADVVVYSFDE